MNRFVVDDWTDVTFNDMVSAGVVEEHLEDHSLRHMGRRIAGQQASTLVPVLRSVFQVPSGANAVVSLQRAVGELNQLVMATNDHTMSNHLSGLSPLVARAAHQSQTQRSVFLADMRAWVFGLADLIDEGEAQKLRRACQG